MNERYNTVKKLNFENQQGFLNLGEKLNNITFILTHPAYILLDSYNPLGNLSLNSNKILPLIGRTTIMQFYTNELKAICNSSGVNDFLNCIKITGFYY